MNTQSLTTTVRESRLQGIVTAPRAWTLVACFAFLAATAYAIAVVVFRLPLQELQQPLLFRVSLALHVELAVYFWLLATMASTWSAAREESADPVSPRDLAWPGLAGLGTVLVVLSPLQGGIPEMLDYFPWLRGNVLFFSGFAIFTAAVAVAAVAAAYRLVSGREVDAWRGVGISALPVLASLATLGMTWVTGETEPVSLAWAAGHVLLFAHVSAMCWEWGRMAGRFTGQACLARRAAWLVAVTGMGMPLIPLLGKLFGTDPAPWFTWSMSWLLWPPAMALGAVLLLRLAQRIAPPPLIGGVQVGSLLGIAYAFFVSGCLVGALIDGPTTLVTAHYHAAVGAVALTRMATTYLDADRLAFGVPEAKAVRRQWRTYAMALLLLSSGLVVGAIDAAPRKTSAGELVQHGLYYKVGMSVSGFGGLFAIAGSLWLVVNLLGPVVGKRAAVRQDPSR